MNSKNLTSANSANCHSYVTKIGCNDVLFGRGLTIDNLEGNKRFRVLVKKNKDEYLSSNRHQRKHEIALEIIETIEGRGGKFLRIIESVEEAASLGVPEGTEAWTFADANNVMLKVKQALRTKKRPAKAASLSVLRAAQQKPAVPTTEETSSSVLARNDHRDIESSNVAEGTSTNNKEIPLHQDYTASPFTNLLRLQRAQEAASIKYSGIQANSLLSSVPFQSPCGLDLACLANIRQQALIQKLLESGLNDLNGQGLTRRLSAANLLLNSSLQDQQHQQRQFATMSSLDAMTLLRLQQQAHLMSTSRRSSNMSS